MNTRNIIKLFKENYNIAVGENFVPNHHGGLNLDISGVVFNLHAGVAISTAKISFISLNYETNDRKELYKALEKIKTYFDIEVDIEYGLDFSTAFITSWKIDDELNISTKLILYDWINSSIPRYKIELRVEKE